MCNRRGEGQRQGYQGWAGPTVDTASALGPTTSAHSGSPKGLTQQKHGSQSWPIRKLVTSGAREGLGQAARPPLCLGLAVALPYLGFLQDSSSPGHPACLSRRAGTAFMVAILAQHKLPVVHWGPCVVAGPQCLVRPVECGWGTLAHFPGAVLLPSPKAPSSPLSPGLLPLRWLWRVLC